MAVDLRQVRRGDAEQAEVTGDVVDDPQLAVRDEGLLGSAVAYGKNMSSLIDMTSVVAVMRPSAALRSPLVWRATSPRCHFHAMVSRSFGSIAVKYGSRNPVRNSSFDSKPRPLPASCFQNSVEKPMTAHR